MNAVPAIEVSALSVSYGEVVALTDVDLAVEPGRVCALVGTNGSGKSTLFAALTGRVVAAGGRVRIQGRSVRTARREGLIAHVPQREAVDWEFPISVREVVAAGRYGHLGPTRRGRSADRQAVEAALERVDLTGLADRQIGQLSGGQRRRAFVARGLAQGAQVMLLDEPFAGVDRRTELMITDLLRQLAAEGMTVLVSTHDLSGLGRLCDEVVALRGRLVMHGRVEDVLRPDVLAEVFGLDLRDLGN